ncbi:MAG: endo-1,4-beta-xylanase [Bacteroidales bacterium]
MKKLSLKAGLVLTCALLYVPVHGQSPTDMTLKKALEGKFYIGTAMNGFQILGKDTVSLKLIKSQFNSVVAENVMKSGIIQPREGTFNFDLPDQFVEFADQQGMYTVGHCLIWHSQAPRWFFMDEEGNQVSREVLIERMKKHIYTVAGRYRGKVDCWDVVNESFEDDGSWRENQFYRIIGPEYVELAFRFAHEADPDAELIYNDYSMFHKGRRDAVVALVNDLKAKGLRVDGIGMQAHYGMDYPEYEDFEQSIIAFAGTGAQVHITEMDISVLPNPDPSVGADVRASFEYQKRMDPYTDGLPEEVRQALHDRYLTFFKIFLKHQDKIKRVTLWGVSDGQSWKNNWPIRGRTNYPLLFDREFKPKPVVADIIRATGE